MAKKTEKTDRPESGPGSKGHPFGPVKPIVPKAQKPTGVVNTDDGLEIPNRRIGVSTNRRRAEGL
jgi:hypothetical protein